MSSRKSSRKVSVARWRELEVAAAVAREAVMQMHVARALKLIDLAGARVSVVRMLGIYVRVQGLTGASAEMLAHRALAAVGHRVNKGPVASLFVEGEASPDDGHGSWFHLVRKRLRGRVHDDLRRWVELQTGATQVALLELHVRHARNFVRELAETHSIADACALYAEMADVAAHMQPTLYMFVLDRLAADELPRGKPRRTTEEQVPLFKKLSRQRTQLPRKRAEAS